MTPGAMRVGEAYVMSTGPRDDTPFVYVVTEAGEEGVCLVLLDNGGDEACRPGAEAWFHWDALEGFEWKRLA